VTAPLPQKKIAKAAGEKWQSLNRVDKEKYEGMAELDIKRYEVEMKAYKRSI
jgi:hypothetical protein